VPPPIPAPKIEAPPVEVKPTIPGLSEGEKLPVGFNEAGEARLGKNGINAIMGSVDNGWVIAVDEHLSNARLIEKKAPAEGRIIQNMGGENERVIWKSREAFKEKGPETYVVKGEEGPVRKSAWEIPRDEFIYQRRMMRNGKIEDNTVLHRELVEEALKEGKYDINVLKDYPVLVNKYKNIIGEKVKLGANQGRPPEFSKPEMKRQLALEEPIPGQTTIEEMIAKEEKAPAKPTIELPDGTKIDLRPNEEIIADLKSRGTKPGSIDAYMSWLKKKKAEVKPVEPTPLAPEVPPAKTFKFSEEEHLAAAQRFSETGRMTPHDREVLIDSGMLEAEKTATAPPSNAPYVGELTNFKPEQTVRPAEGLNFEDIDLSAGVPFGKIAEKIGTKVQEFFKGKPQRPEPSTEGMPEPARLIVNALKEGKKLSAQQEALITKEKTGRMEEAISRSK
jgi:hypothetical protein